uniref:Bro-N domain-containing protein n=1 Tax=viral metagenome TaxID=1070528 RepID=A0A6C0H908_9ZZZZ
MELITIENKQYILGDYILNNALMYSKGVRSSRELVKKKNINEKKYIYARYVNNQWIKTEGKSIKFDKILIRYDYAKLITELQLIEDNNNNNNNNNVNPITIIEDTKIEEAPKILILEDSEKFKDNSGKILEIETRGDRNVESIYFKVKDIMIIFEIPNLIKTITDKRYDGFSEHIHYKYFNCIKIGEPVNTTNKKNIVKELYLTYEGILRVLFASLSPKIKKFIKWATETLFAIQIGTINHKHILVSNILGVNAQTIKEVFNTYANTITCIYLFTFGYAKDLRDSMNINDSINNDSIIAKFGFTNNLTRRTQEHIRTYGNIKNCDLKLKNYIYIDPQFLSNAENDIKYFFTVLNLKLNYENCNEIVIIPQNLLKIVSDKYNHIGKQYAGHIDELNIKIKDLENELLKEKYINELDKEKHKNEMKDKELEIEKCKNELEKEQHKNEILNYKIILLNNNIK